MQAEEGEETSSQMIDPWSLFLYWMTAPMTREKYRGRLAKFLIALVIQEGQFDANDKNYKASGN